MTPREWRDNYLRTVEFRYPKWIIGRIVVSMSTWLRYGRRLEEILARHKLVFPFYRRGSVDFENLGVRRRGRVFTDSWGCRWRFLQNGLQEQVVEHPSRIGALWTGL